jgi:hypothetical protein
LRGFMSSSLPGVGKPWVPSECRLLLARLKR